MLTTESAPAAVMTSDRSNVLPPRPENGAAVSYNSAREAVHNFQREVTETVLGELAQTLDNPARLHTVLESVLPAIDLMCRSLGVTVREPSIGNGAGYGVGPERALTNYRKGIEALQRIGPSDQLSADDFLGKKLLDDVRMCLVHLERFGEQSTGAPPSSHSNLRALGIVDKALWTLSHLVPVTGDASYFGKLVQFDSSPSKEITAMVVRDLAQSHPDRMNNLLERQTAAYCMHQPIPDDVSSAITKLIADNRSSVRQSVTPLLKRLVDDTYSSIVGGYSGSGPKLKDFGGPPDYAAYERDAQGSFPKYGTLSDYVARQGQNSSPSLLSLRACAERWGIVDPSHCHSVWSLGRQLSMTPST